MATSLRMGISTVQSRPSSRATRGRGCIGPFRMGGRIPESSRKKIMLIVAHEQLLKDINDHYCLHFRMSMVKLQISDSTVHFLCLDYPLCCKS